MRSLLLGLLLTSTVLFASACTRANPDALHLGAGDLATPPLGGGSRDLALTAPADLAGNLPAEDLARSADLAVFAGVSCGSLICTAPDSACCSDGNGERCTTPNPQTCGGGGGRLLACDGPEDCPFQTCCATGGGGDVTSLCRGFCGGGEVPMCHQLSDCLGFGWVACCPRAGTAVSRCSKSACQ
jgi:hypothetical protein